MTDYVTVDFDGLSVELECYVDDGIVYVESVETTETVTSECADFLFRRHEPELALLAQEKFDEAKTIRRKLIRPSSLTGRLRQYATEF